jgi:sec-independent protein translocase protein TatC
MFDARRMSFFGHIDEFRRRLAVVLAAVLLGSLIAYPFGLDIIKFLIRPLGLHAHLTAFTPLEAFWQRFKVGMFAGVIATAPIWIYELLAFISPALKPKERKWFFPGLAALVVFFFAGVVFCYLIILQPGFQWLAEQGGGVIQLLPRVSDYLSFVLYFLLGFGLAFETPIVVLVLVKLGIIKADVLFREWRWAVVIIMVVAAIATPDWSPITMGALSIAMLILYFGAAFVARYI